MRPNALAAAVLVLTTLWLSAADPHAVEHQGQGRAKTSARPSAQVAGYSFDLVREYKRGTDAFTQGLVLHGGRLFEGTGLYGESTLRETLLQNGAQTIVRKRPLPDGQALSDDQKRYQSGRLGDYGYSGPQVGREQAKGVLFGEGITVRAGRIYQLTWVEGLCLVWDISNWNTPARTFAYTGEGWGLTHDGTHLIMSDGSATLQFRHPDTFKVVRTIQVKDPRTGAEVDKLNELEFVNGRVFANVYGSRRIAIINPKTGVLEAYVLLDGRGDGGGAGPSLLPQPLWDALDARWEVLNGIAHDAANDHLIVTGKRWPAVFEIKIRKVREAI